MYLDGGMGGGGWLLTSFFSIIYILGLGLYRKLYGHANSPTLFQLYLSFVRPLLEYAAPVWDPHHKGLIDSLESVQKFGLKVVTGCLGL